MLKIRNFTGNLLPVKQGGFIVSQLTDKLQRMAGSIAAGLKRKSLMWNTSGRGQNVLVSDR